MNKLTSDRPDVAIELVSDEQLELVSGGRTVPTETQRAGVERYGIDDFNAYNDNGH